MVEEEVADVVGLLDDLALLLPEAWVVDAENAVPLVAELAEALGVVG